MHKHRATTIPDAHYENQTIHRLFRYSNSDTNMRCTAYKMWNYALRTHVLILGINLIIKSIFRLLRIGQNYLYVLNAKCCVINTGRTVHDQGLNCYCAIFSEAVGKVIFRRVSPATRILAYFLKRMQLS